jgi:membrane protein
MGRIYRILTNALAIGLVAQRLTGRHHAEAPPPPRRISPPPEQPPDPNPQQHQHHQPAYRGMRGKYRLLSGAVSHFIDDDCTTMGAALAYYTTFSIAPLLLIVISIVGLIFGRAAAQGEIQGQIQGLIGSGAATQVSSMIKNAGDHSSTGIFGAALGMLALLAGATGAFAQLQSSLNRIWHVKPDPHAGGVKNFIGQRVLSLGMILAIAFLLLVSLAVSAALSAFGTFVSGFLPQGFSAPLLSAIEFVVSLVIIAALFAAIFKVLPDAQIEWGDVAIGAAATAILFTAGKFGIGMYLGHSGTANAYGAAGSFVLIVLWIYYSSLILLLGAELTAAWAGVHAGIVRPKSGAVRVEMEEHVKPQQAA